MPKIHLLAHKRVMDAWACEEYHHLGNNLGLNTTITFRVKDRLRR